MRRYPKILQINAFYYLSRLREKYKYNLQLDTIPKEELAEFVNQGFDLVWFMGVWKRSPVSRSMALKEPNLHKAFDAFLPGWTDADVSGSPYAVYGYELDPYLGDLNSLKSFHKKLNALGLKLILDFVPNHLALDHPWTETFPELFVNATREAQKTHPDWFYKASSGKWLAHGRDPFFAPWSDTVQVNFFSSKMREVLTGELLRVAELCDGVRCDMAMLGLNEVFTKVWGNVVKAKLPKEEFWTEAIRKVKAVYPSFLMIAEVYWDFEWKLQCLGFDYTYDKKLYDRLLESDAAGIRGHLTAAPDYQAKCMRFIENHDEERAPIKFGREKSLAAAAITATIPGLRFFQDGQLLGRKVRTPIHLRREAFEKPDGALVDYYRGLFQFLHHPIFHTGHWELLESMPAWENNPTHRNLIVWVWQELKDWRLIAVNFSDQCSQARIPVPFMLSKKTIRLRDRKTGEIYDRDSSELEKLGLFIELKGWGCHWFEPA